MNDSQRASKANAQIQVRQHLLTQLPGLLVAAKLMLLSAPALANDLPTGGAIVAGTGSINPSGNALTVTQNTQNMAVNWDTFSVGAGHAVNFVQPSAQAAVLNRVMGADVSVIQGAINANGRVFLVNPNGVLFTTTAQVNVGSMVASTLNMSTQDFMSGNYRFEGSSSNAIVNQGNIKAVGDGNGGGTVALIAAKVTNLGTLTAAKGNVLIGAGQKVRLDLGGPVKLEVEQAAVDALIEQGGAIKANGGLVYLTAKAAGNLAATVINHTGITEAQTLQTGESGQIYLLGDMHNDRINVGGTLDASAPNGGDGGFIETSAAQVVALQGRKVTTQAATGKTGTYLIDPNDFIIAASGGNITGAQLGADLNLNDMLISTAVDGTAGGNGDIFVNDAITWRAATKLTLNAERNIAINADITAQNTNGQVALQYGQGSAAAGNAATYTIQAGAKANLQAGENFSTKLGADGAVVNWTVITSLGSQGSTTGADLQGINGNLSGRFVLGADIDATATSGWSAGAGFMPIGNSATSFTGAFDGLGHTISGLTINRPGLDRVGLLGSTINPEIHNVGLVNTNVVGKDLVGGLVGYKYGGSVSNSYATGQVVGGLYTGGLVGANMGSISNSYAAVTVSGDFGAGGLAGYNAGTVKSSYATGQVTGSNWYTGGLLGGNAGNGSVSNSYATGNVIGHLSAAGGLVGGSVDNSSISYSFATGNVSSDVNDVGGLVGSSYASISNSYATGNVSGSAVNVGGLVGIQYSGAISQSYATGEVNGPNASGSVGGLVGRQNAGTISTSYWNTQTTGQNHSPGSADTFGLTTAGMMNAANFVGWDLATAGGSTSVWRIYEGLSTPLLRHFLTEVSIDGDLGYLPITKVYDGSSALSESQANLTWRKNGITFDPDRTLLSGNLLELSGKDAGLQTLTLTQGYYTTSPLGYDITYNITGHAQTATITPKALTINGTTVANKTYDGTTTATATAGTLTGFVGTETLGVSVANALFTNKNAGEQTATVAYTLANGSYGENQTALASNYSLANTESIVASITPRPVTVKADDKTKTPTEADPLLTWRLVEGSLVANDSLTIPLTRTAGDGVGVYTILAQSLHNPNYQVTTESGRLTIVPSNAPSNDIATPGRNAIESATSSAFGSGLNNNAAFNRAGSQTTTPSLLSLSSGAAQPESLALSSRSMGSAPLQSGGLVFVPAGTDSAATGLRPVFVVSSGISLPPADAGSDANMNRASTSGESEPQQ